MDAKRFTTGDFTQAEVDAWRGSAEETLNRIRQIYNLSPDVFSDLDIFVLANQNFYSHTDQDAKQAGEEDYKRFVQSNRQTLPYYVLRAGDPDVDYKYMHAF